MLKACSMLNGIGSANKKTKELYCDTVRCGIIVLFPKAVQFEVILN